LQALRETDDLLNQLQRSHEQLQLSQAASEAAAALFKATRRRYERGVTDYLPVLDALQSLQQQQRQHLALQAEHQRILVRLHTALGLPRAVQDHEAPT
jgi:multidrug efflux system outer membrane protein